MPHLDTVDTIDNAVVMEEEQADLVLVGVAVDMNLVRQRIARRRQIIHIGQLTTQESIDPLTLVEEVCPHVGDQHEIGLA